MTHRPGRLAAAIRRTEEACRGPVCGLQHTAAALGDYIFAVLIIVAATLAWAPLIGLSAARETVAANRHRRARLAEIDRRQSPVWGRQARRNALGWQRQSEAARWRPDP